MNTATTTTVVVGTVYNETERAAFLDMIRDAIGGAYWFSDCGAAPIGGGSEVFVEATGFESELEATQNVLAAIAWHAATATRAQG
jgi:hypothetical protein